jgi:hypothetical protein
MKRDSISVKKEKIVEKFHTVRTYKKFRIFDGTWGMEDVKKHGHDLISLYIKGTTSGRSEKPKKEYFNNFKNMKTTLHVGYSKPVIQGVIAGQDLVTIFKEIKTRYPDCGDLYVETMITKFEGNTYFWTTKIDGVKTPKALVLKSINKISYRQFPPGYAFDLVNGKMENGMAEDICKEREHIAQKISYDRDFCPF